MLYNHDLLKLILTYHQPKADSSCICGWAVLGASHPEHVVIMYEQAIGIKK